MPSIAARNIVQFECFAVDLSAGRLLKRGLRISLREQSFQVLCALLEHPGQVVTREELRQRLWGSEVFVDFDNNLNAVVAHLRERLGDSAEHPRFIETLPRRGYRFLSEVHVSPVAGVEPKVGRARLLVLPFLNLSPDPVEEYFSDAMTDEIITAVATVAPERLAVIARTTAMRYKDSHKDIGRIGRELDVDYIIEGAVRRTEDQVALNVQLIQTSDQAHLFAKKYDAPMRDVFSLHSSIAHAIATHLPAGMGSIRAEAAPGRIRRKPTEDLLAYNLYIQGRYLLERDLLTPENFAGATRCFEAAIARDPHFALAYHCLADLSYGLSFMGLQSPQEALAGIFHALHALEIDDTLAETHALLAMCRVDYDWAEVRRELDIALQLNPASPMVRLRNAVGLMPHGRLEEAASEIERGLEIDPLSLLLRCWLAAMFWMGRHYERAVDELQRVLEVDSNYSMAYLVLGHVRCMERKFEKSVAALRKAAELYGHPPMVLGWLGLALAQGGHVAEARALLDQFHAMATKMYVPPTCFAWIHFGLGETDAALAWMDRAVDARDHMMIPIKLYPFLDPLRPDPRFIALMRKMNLQP